jgi:NAD+ kinase
MTSTTGSQPPSASPPIGRAVRRAAVITHGKRETIGPALERLEGIARRAGVELVLPHDERAKHGRGEDGTGRVEEADLAVVLGGDGTMLRALDRFLGTDVPVIGVNFGRVGFLSSIDPGEMESALQRAFAGEYEIVELATLVVEVEGRGRSGVNDAVITSSTLGRMVQLAWAIGGEDLGVINCDGIIASTPSGSTAYNLSNGGPVLVWGLEAMAITFVAPHSLRARPLVVPKGRDLTVANRTPDVSATVLVDGHTFADLPPGSRADVRLGDGRSLLATMPETTFFQRYRKTFAS